MRGPEHDESFVRFVRECGPQLYRVAYLLTGQTATAEDLYQAALTRSYVAWRRVREQDAYRYVRRVLVNLHTDWWRAPRTWRERTVSAPPDRAGVDDPAAAVVHRDQIGRALQRLTRRERAAVVLRYFADLSEHDTAQELGVSVGTVKSTTARALAKLRLSPDLTEPSEEELSGHA
jgi:RNA polymerase sigma-70 factor (sigma-E family)